VSDETTPRERVTGKRSKPCANCGKSAVEHWVRPGVGSMYCERSASVSDAKYDPGPLTPAEHEEAQNLGAALRVVVAFLAAKGSRS